MSSPYPSHPHHPPSRPTERSDETQEISAVRPDDAPPPAGDGAGSWFTSPSEPPPSADPPTIGMPAVRDVPPAAAMPSYAPPVALTPHSVAPDMPPYDVPYDMQGPAAGGHPPVFPPTAVTAAPPGMPLPGNPRRRRRLLAIVAAATTVVVLLAGTAMAVALTSDVPGGTTVLGVDIGGLTRAEAVKALRDGLGARTTQPVAVTIEKAPAKINPADVGLAIDYDATVDRAATGWPNPFGGLFGGREVQPVVTVDAEKLDKALAEPAKDVVTAGTRPAIRFSGTTPEPTYPEAGRGLDRESSAKAVREGWLRADTVAIPLVQVAPATTKDEVDRLLKELAEPAVAAPVKVTTARGSFTISPEAIAASLILEADQAGKIVPRVDPVKLRQATATQLKAVEVPAKDATIAASGSQLVTTPHVQGQAVDVNKAAVALLEILPKEEPRTLQAPVVPVNPKLTTEGIAKLGIKERISTFTTRFPAGQPRTTNIRIGARAIHNQLVLPGKTFSVNDTTGARTKAKGYVDAPAIIGGKYKNDTGGGVSQLATTLFNAVFYSGLKDVAHTPHGYYISRYPPVIEATLFYPGLDLKFRNDSPHGVLITTAWTPTSITVSLWGTKRYTIKASWGDKRNITQPKERILTEDDCHSSTGKPGFTQDAWRIFYQGGREIKRQKFTWKYNAEPKFVCKPPAARPG